MTTHSCGEKVGFEIRVANTGDIEGIYDVNREIHEDQKTIQKPLNIPVSLIERRDDQITFVALHDSKVVGYLRLEISALQEPVDSENNIPSTPSGERQQAGICIYIRPSYQGKKIGYALTWFSEAFVRTSMEVSKLITNVSVENDKSMCLIKNCGFKPEGKPQITSDKKHGQTMVKIIER